MNAVPPRESFVVEIEQDALGTFILSGNLASVASKLRPEHFIEGLHQWLYGHLVACSERYGTTGIPTLLKLLPEDERKAWDARLPDGLTVQSYVARLAGNSTSQDIERAAEKVIRQWARIETGRIGGLIQSAATDPLLDTGTLLAESSERLEAMRSELRRGPRRATMLSLSGAAERAFATAEEAMQRGTGLSGVTWGLSDVNRMTGGIHAGEVVIMAARPSQGKTATALSCAIKNAKSGVGVGFISLEMGAESLAARAITDIAYDWSVKVPYSEFYRGRIDRSQMDALRAATRDLERLPLVIEEQAGLSMADIRVKTERMAHAMEKQGTPLAVLYIDYLGLIRPTKRYAGNRVAEITEISGAIKELARDLGIGVVALSQLSRALESRNDKRPQLSDLRESGALEQDADTVIFLYREAYYLERERGTSHDAEAERVARLADCQNALEFIIAKQRQGPIGTVNLFVDIACSAVRNGGGHYG